VTITFDGVRISNKTSCISLPGLTAALRKSLAASRLTTFGALKKGWKSNEQALKAALIGFGATNADLARLETLFRQSSTLPPPAPQQQAS
jgi:hypothetical protein